MDEHSLGCYGPNQETIMPWIEYLLHSSWTNMVGSLMWYITMGWALISEYKKDFDQGWLI